MKQRIIGFDIARAFAIFGMVIVNFKIAQNALTGNEFLLWFASLFEGRASALFVVLAGIGITFLTNKSDQSNDGSLINKSQKILIKRGFLLIAIGLAYTPIWPADILHFYGFYFLVAAALIKANDRGLLIAATVAMALFPMMMFIFDYEHGWDWNTLTYHGFWTLDGMIRDMLFNGFHPVFPWCAFLLLGMWLGRQNLSERTVRNRLLTLSATIWVITEAAFFAAKILLKNYNVLDITTEELEFLFSTSIIPPLPQYIIAAGSLAVVIIICCLNFGQKFSGSKLAIWLNQTGQLSLTLYVAHVIIGMATLEAIGKLENQTIECSLISTFIFSASGVIFSVLWLKYFKTGPLEWLFRKIAS